MAEYQVCDRVFVAIRLGRVAAEDIVDRPAVVKAGWNLAVAIEAHVPTRISKSLDLIALGDRHDCEVGVGVAPALIEWKIQFYEPLLDPVLKVKFLVLTILAADEQVTIARGDDLAKKCGAAR